MSLNVPTKRGNNDRNSKAKSLDPQGDRRRDQAKARQAQRSRLSPAGQLEALDKRLGVGVGAKRERARLTALLASGKVPEGAKVPRLPPLSSLTK